MRVTLKRPRTKSWAAPPTKRRNGNRDIMMVPPGKIPQRVSEALSSVLDVPRSAIARRCFPISHVVLCSARRVSVCRGASEVCNVCCVWGTFYDHGRGWHVDRLLDRPETGTGVCHNKDSRI
eukprot:2880901-Prymnesium_polylepis.1